MNYLAHAYLSFNESDILVGNMISDFVKGKKKFDFSPGIQTGIMLHRAIDEFTDTHEATIFAKQFFRPQYRLYAAAFIDIVYDYFLANDPNEFASEQALYDFSQDTYRMLSAYESIFPSSFLVMFPFMRQHNWLYNYRWPEGIRKSFGGLARRARYIEDAEPAFVVFEENHEALKQGYDHFFPLLKPFAARQLELLKTT
ncbi:MAG: DUF479 domain-containing protein [Williamsia sp.]|nr:DUF479 domain-containing protein [Williamsia sp.]